MLPLLAYSISGRLRPLPLFLLGTLCLEVFFSPCESKILFYFFLINMERYLLLLPIIFWLRLGEITNQDCAGLPAKA